MSAIGLRIAAYAIVVALIFVVGHRVGYSAGDKHGDKVATARQWAIDDAAIQEVKKSAKALYDARVAENATLQAKIDTDTITRKAEHDAATKNLDSLEARNRALARAAGGLRDPGTQADRRGSGASPTGPPTIADARQPEDLSAQAGRLLSGRATEFLLGFARDADGDAQTAAECVGFLRAEGY